MMKTKIMHIGAVAAMVLGSLGAITPATARDQWDGGYNRGGYDRGGYNGGYGGGYGGYNRYNGYNGSYNQGYNGSYDRSYNGYNNRGRNGYNGYRCRNDGATGTVIGAIAGGLLGNSVAGRRGDRTAGTILGAGVGALAGRAIDKGGSRC